MTEKEWLGGREPAGNGHLDKKVPEQGRKL